MSGEASDAEVGFVPPVYPFDKLGELAGLAAHCVSPRRRDRGKARPKPFKMPQPVTSTRNCPYRLRWAESRFSALSNFPAAAGVLRLPCRISRLVVSRP